MSDYTPGMELGDLKAIKEDMADVKASLQRISEALTKLAVLEDRQSGQTTAIERLVTRIETVEQKQHGMELRFATAVASAEHMARVESRVNDLQTKMNTYDATAKTVGIGAKVLWTIFGGAIGSIAVALIPVVLGALSKAA